MELVLFFLAALLAEIVGTVAGFGSSTIFMPLALFFVEFRAALVFVALFHISGNIAKALLFRKGFNFKLLLMFGLPSVLLTVVGALLVNFLAQDLLKLLLGLFLCAFSLWSLFGKKFVLPKSALASAIGGSVSGFFAGLLGTGGAFRAVFLSAMKLRKDAYIVMNAVIAILVDLTRIPIYIGGGFLPQGSSFIILALILIAILGAFLGKRIVDVLPQKTFRSVVLVAIGLVGVKFVIDYFAG